MKPANRTASVADRCTPQADTDCDGSMTCDCAKCQAEVAQRVAAGVRNGRGNILPFRHDPRRAAAARERREGYR